MCRASEKNYNFIKEWIFQNGGHSENRKSFREGAELLIHSFYSSMYIFCVSLFYNLPTSLPFRQFQVKATHCEAGRAVVDVVSTTYKYYNIVYIYAL